MPGSARRQLRLRPAAVPLPLGDELSGTISASTLRRRPPSQSAITGDRSSGALPI